MIFLSVLVVLAGGIFYYSKYVRGGNKPEEVSPVAPPVNPVNPSVSDPHDAVTEGGDRKNPDNPAPVNPDAGSAGNPADGGGQDNPASPETADGKADTDATDGTAPSSDNPAVTPIDQPPEKGVPWAGDPVEAVNPDGIPVRDANTTIANALLFDSASGSGIVTYEVVGGDTMGRIAARHHTTVEAICHLNKRKKTSVRAGEKLKLIPGPWRIEVSKSKKTLTLYRIIDGKEELFYVFAIGIGRLNRTPQAEFRIFDRLRHPKWYAPDGAIYSYGDPKNPLGDYFLKLSSAANVKRPLIGYGIHGSNDDSSIGKSLSNGCIRMKNAEVERIWLAVPNGCPVSIKD